MFKIIEDASVPRGTVKFEPVWIDGKYLSIDAMNPNKRVDTTNVYVNPLDLVCDGKRDEWGFAACTMLATYSMKTEDDGSLTLGPPDFS